MLKTEVAANFRERRTRLMTLDPNACFVFFGSGEVVRNHNTHFKFKQESTFHYLTDFDEPDAVLVLVAGESHLFVLEKDETMEIWNGDRYGIKKAKTVFQVEHTHLVQNFYEALTPLQKHSNKVYYGLGNSLDRDRRMLHVLHEARHFQGQGRFGHLPVFDPLPLVTELRVVKDDFEIAQ